MRFAFYLIEFKFTQCCAYSFYASHLILSLICEQVRELGKILNVPVPFLKRHPFPGPGLAVRVLGDVTEGNALDILRQVLENMVESVKLLFLYSLEAQGH